MAKVVKLPKIKIHFFYDIVQIALILLFCEVSMSAFNNDPICIVSVLKGSVTCVYGKGGSLLVERCFSCHFSGLNRVCKENRHKFMRDSDSSRGVIMMTLNWVNFFMSLLITT